jgi:hypothetical protein
MGVAFASSLLGLAGSLIVGLLEVFSGRGQNRFYGELEEWLSTITRVGFSGGEGEEGAQNTMLGAMMEQMSEQMDGIARMYAQTGQDQAHVQSHLMAMTASLEKLTQKLDQGQTEALERVAASQERMIARMGEGGAAMGWMRRAGCVCVRSTCRCCACLRKSQAAGKKASRKFAVTWPI